MLVVADRTSATETLLEEVRQRAQEGSDPLHEREADEIIISTLSRLLSRWMHLDLPSKVRGLGRPVTHVEGVRAPAERELAGEPPA